MEEAKRIGNLIKQYRKAQGMTQEDLSKACGIHVSTLKKYEIGTQKPKVANLTQIASALGISIIDFLDIKIESTSDVLSLVNTICKQTDSVLEYETNDEGDIVDSSIRLKFNDDSIAKTLALYLSNQKDRFAREDYVFYINGQPTIVEKISKKKKK